MSRYRIPAIHAHYDVALGYDPPLGTFFAQISDHTVTSEAEHDGSLLVLWVGTDVHEITTVDALQAHIKDYARIPDEVRHSLELDARDLGFRPNFGTALAVLLSAQRTVREEKDARPSSLERGRGRARTPASHHRRVRSSDDSH